MIFGTQWYILFNVIAGARLSERSQGGGGNVPGSRAGSGGGTVILPGSFPTT